MGQIIIDGVVFEFDGTGEKMIKIGPVPQEPEADDGSQDVGSSRAPVSGSQSTPLNASVDGQQYVRTKNGNLISAELLAQRRAQKEASIKKDKLAHMGRSIGDRQRAR